MPPQAPPTAPCSTGRRGLHSLAARGPTPHAPHAPRPPVAHNATVCTHARGCHSSQLAAKYNYDVATRLHSRCPSHPPCAPFQVTGTRRVGHIRFHLCSFSMQRFGRLICAMDLHGAWMRDVVRLRVTDTCVVSCSQVSSHYRLELQT